MIKWGLIIFFVVGILIVSADEVGWWPSKDNERKYKGAPKDFFKEIAGWLFGIPALIIFFMNLRKLALVLFPWIITQNWRTEYDGTSFCRISYICMVCCLAADCFLGVRALIQFQTIRVFRDWIFNEVYVYGYAPLICAFVFMLLQFAGRLSVNTTPPLKQDSLLWKTGLMLALLTAVLLPVDPIAARSFHLYW